jgi:hypothetical protein
MKQTYLDDLRDLLELYQMSEMEIDDIVSDYEEMYEGWLEKGFSDEEVVEKLGRPHSNIKALTSGVKKKATKTGKSEKIIAVSPFVALTLFFVLGFVWDLWAYSWMAFLLIPVTAIIAEMSKKKDEHVFVALSPFVAVIGYFILGFVYNLWHPGWLIFLIIPVIAIVVERKSVGPLNTLVALSPFAAIVAFIYLVDMGYAATGWMVFLVIPAIAVFNEDNKAKAFLWEVLILGGALGYYLTYMETGNIQLSLIAFIPLALFSLFQTDGPIFHISKEYRLVVISALVIYLVLGFGLGLWTEGWLVFLAIPVTAIMKETKGAERIIALTPFIAVTLFMLIGFLLDGWAYGWLVFLIIPVTAIIASDN